MNTVARLESVTKNYGRTRALRGVSLRMGEGITAVLGPNGAGKSTAIDVLTGLRSPDSGTVEVLGGDPKDPGVRARLGVASQSTGLPWRLTVRETLELCAAHYPAPTPLARLTEQLELGRFLDKRNGTLSGGQRRRVALAVALVGAPRFVVLDEPSTGLDLESREGLWQVVREASRDGISVLLSTHYLEEAEALADQVVLLAEGLVAQEGTVDAVCAAVGLDVIAIDAVDLPPLSGVEKVETVGRRIRLFTRSADELVRELVALDVPFSGLKVGRSGLADAIRALGAGGTPRPAPAPAEPRTLIGVSS